MKILINEHNEEQRENDVINRLEEITCKLEKLIDYQLSLRGYDGYENDLVQLVQAYVPTELALLQLYKEESEENDHE